jgi:hypothetical protein
LEKDETISQLLQQMERVENHLKLQIEMTLKLQQDLEAREKRLLDTKEKYGENNADQYKQLMKLTHELRSTQEQLRLEKEKVTLFVHSNMSEFFSIDIYPMYCIAFIM